MIGDKYVRLDQLARPIPIFSWSEEEMVTGDSNVVKNHIKNEFLQNLPRVKSGDMQTIVLCPKELLPDH